MYCGWTGRRLLTSAATLHALAGAIKGSEVAQVRLGRLKKGPPLNCINYPSVVQPYRTRAESKAGEGP